MENVNKHEVNAQYGKVEEKMMVYVQLFKIPLTEKPNPKYDENIALTEDVVQSSKGNFHQISKIQGDLPFLAPFAS